MSNRVVVTLEGRDNLSSVIQGATAKGVAMGTAITAAVSAAGAAVGAAFKFMGGQVKSASDTQLDMIGSAGALKDVMGGTFEDSMKFAKGLNKEFVSLGAALPGTADDFSMVGRAVSDDVIRAFKTADGIDLDGAKNTLLGLTEGWTLLAQQSKTSSAEAGQLLTRLIGGDRSALKMMMFDRSPAFKSALNKVLEANGKTLKDWDQVSTKERAKWLDEATKLTIPPEAISAMSNTLDGVTSEWKNALLDPTTGVFGMLREIPEMGDMTALDGLTNLFQSVDGLFKALADKFPFKPDVMAGLLSVFNSLSSMVDGATSALQGFSLSNLNLSSLGDKLQKWIVDGVQKVVTMFQSLPPIDVANVVSQLLTVQEKIRGWLLNTIQAITSSLNLSSAGNVTSFMSGAISQIMTTLNQVGQVLAQKFNQSVQVIRDAISSVDWSAIGSQIGTLLGQAVSQGLGVIMSTAVAIDWGGVIAGIVELRNAIVNGTRAMLFSLGGVLLGQFMQGAAIIGAAVMAQVTPIVQSVITGVQAMMAQIGMAIQSIVSTISSAFQSMVAGMMAIGASLSAAFTGLMTSIQTAMTSVVTTLSAAFQGMVAGMMAIGASLSAAFTGLMASIQASIANVVATLSAAFQSIMASMTAMGASLTAQFTAIMSSIQATMANIMASISSTIASIGTGILGGLQAAASAAIAAAATLAGQVMSGVQNLVATIASAVNSALASAGSAIKGAIGGAVSNAVASAKSTVSNIIGGSKFRGQPSGLSAYVAADGRASLLGAALNESRNMPPGSDLVMANTSEAILTKRQQGSLLEQLSNKNIMVKAQGQKTSEINNNPTVNVYTTGDVDIEQITRAIFDNIDKHLILATGV